MKLMLTALEARVVGSLIEKQIATPDQYPLSLNALVNACNQKSNRDPVLELETDAVQRTVDALAKKHLVVERSGFGSRVPKYQHRFCNTEYGTLRFTEQELAIVCELLLRGAQTPGELRSHAGRLAQFRDVGEVEAALQSLATRSDGPFVVRLAREPGRRESRFVHLFGETAPVSDASHHDVDTARLPALSQATADDAGGHTGSTAAQGTTAQAATALEQRLDRLEQMVRDLAEELRSVRRRVGDD